MLSLEVEVGTYIIVNSQKIFKKKNQSLINWNIKNVSNSALFNILKFICMSSLSQIVISDQYSTFSGRMFNISIQQLLLIIQS